MPTTALYCLLGPFPFLPISSTHPPAIVYLSWAGHCVKYMRNRKEHRGPESPLTMKLTAWWGKDSDSTFTLTITYGLLFLTLEKKTQVFWQTALWQPLNATPWIFPQLGPSHLFVSPLRLLPALMKASRNKAEVNCFQSNAEFSSHDTMMLWNLTVLCRSVSSMKASVWTLWPTATSTAPWSGSA